MLVFEKQHVVSISLNNYMIKNIFILGTFEPNFKQVLVQLRTKYEKIKTPKTSCLTHNKYFQPKLWKKSLENMEDKILGFHFEPASNKPTRPS